MRKTKIVCTIGPATGTRKALRDLMQAGMDVARLNFSHGETPLFEGWIQIIREEAATTGKAVAILQDLPGPKIRTGAVEGGEIILKSGSRFTLRTVSDAGSEKSVQITHAKLPEEVSPGDPIFIDDGHIRLKVIRVSPTEIETEVVAGGKLRSEQGINVPESTISAPSISEHDLMQLDFGLAHGVDWIALSFVRTAADIEVVRVHCRERGKSPKLMAKIERREALVHLDAILLSCDGVMVARGDLGIEIPVEQVPLTQKKIIALATRMEKPVITATQMLESMVEQPWPTRAEVADVANAVLDGTDAVMLSEETAIGKYPLEAVRIMDRIIREVEDHSEKVTPVERQKESVMEVSEAVAHGACHIADELKASVIVAITRTGQTAQRLSATRPKVPIVAVTADGETARQLIMCRGVIPLTVKELAGLDQTPEIIFNLLCERGLANPGETMILTGGVPSGKPGSTSFVRVFQKDVTGNLSLGENIL